MQRRSLWASLLTVLGVSTARAAETGVHKIVFHVGSGDPALMHVAIHNIVNAAEDYAKRGHIVAIELVANGPGYAMLRADTSPVVAEIAKTKQDFPFVVFAACQNSRAGIAAAEHKAVADIPEVPQATDVAVGVVRISTLEEQGYSYIRV